MMYQFNHSFFAVTLFVIAVLIGNYLRFLDIKGLMEKYSKPQKLLFYVIITLAVEDLAALTLAIVLLDHDPAKPVVFSTSVVAYTLILFIWIWSTLIYHLARREQEQLTSTEAPQEEFTSIKKEEGKAA